MNQFEKLMIYSLTIISVIALFLIVGLGIILFKLVEMDNYYPNSVNGCMLPPGNPLFWEEHLRNHNETGSCLGYISSEKVNISPDNKSNLDRVFMPKRCKMPEWINDFADWNEHLEHHSDTKGCSTYYWGIDNHGN